VIWERKIGEIAGDRWSYDVREDAIDFFVGIKIGSIPFSSKDLEAYIKLLKIPEEWLEEKEVLEKIRQATVYRKILEYLRTNEVAIKKLKSIRDLEKLEAVS